MLWIPGQLCGCSEGGKPEAYTKTSLQEVVNTLTFLLIQCVVIPVCLYQGKRKVSIGLRFANPGSLWPFCVSPRKSVNILGFFRHSFTKNRSHRLNRLKENKD